MVALGPSSSAADAQLMARQLEAWKLSLTHAFTIAISAAAKTSVDANGGNLHQPSFQKAAEAPLALALSLHRASLSPKGDNDVSVVALAVNAVDDALKSPYAATSLASAATTDVVQYATELAASAYDAIVSSLKLSVGFSAPSREAACEELIESCSAPLSAALAKHGDADGAKKDIKAFVQRLFSLCRMVDQSGRRFVDALMSQTPSYVKSALEWSEQDVTRSVLIKITQESDPKKRDVSWQAKLDLLSAALYQAWRAERAAAQAATVAKAAASKVVDDKIAATPSPTPSTQPSIASSGAAPTATTPKPADQRKALSRPCKHCDGDHYDKQCPSPKCLNCGEVMTVENGHIKNGKRVGAAFCPLAKCLKCSGQGHLASACPLSSNKGAAPKYSHVCVAGVVDGAVRRVALDSCAGANLVCREVARQLHPCEASLTSLAGSSRIASKAWIRIGFAGGVHWEGWCAVCDRLPFDGLDILLGTQAVDSLGMDLSAPTGRIRLAGQLLDRLSTAPPLDLATAPAYATVAGAISSVTSAPSSAVCPLRVSLSPAQVGTVVDITAFQFGILLAQPTESEAAQYARAKQRAAQALLAASDLNQVRDSLDSFLQDIHFLAPQRLRSESSGAAPVSRASPTNPAEIAERAIHEQAISSVDLLGEGDPADSFPDDILDSFAIPDSAKGPASESEQERRSWAKAAACQMDAAVPQDIRDEYEAAYFRYSTSVFRPAAAFKGGQLRYPPIRAIPDKCPELAHCWGRPFKASANQEDARWMEDKLRSCVDQGIIEVLPPGSFDPRDKRFRGTALMAKRTPIGEATKRRLVVDFTLSCNRCFEKPKFDMNYIRKLMKDAGLVALFSLDDGVQQFHQFAVAEEDRDVFAFDSPLGWTRFRVMPMGWTRSPYECVLGLNVIFACFGADRLWRYMDELLRMTLSQRTLAPVYRSHLSLDLDFWQRCEEANLLLSREKMQHARQEMTILSLVFGHGVVRKPAAFIKGMATLPEPRKMTELRYALRLLEYLSAMSLVRKPLELIAKLEPLLKVSHWSADTWQPEVHGAAWSELVRLLAAEVALRMPRFDKPMEVTGDFSRDGIAFCITQQFDTGPGVIAVFARKTKGAEKKLDAPAGEAAWMAEAVLKAGDLLEACPEVRFYTDAEALARLSCEPFDPSLSKLLIRSYLRRLQRLRFTVIPKKGTQIPHVDALTRTIAQARQRTAEALMEVDEWHRADREDLGVIMPGMDPSTGVAISQAVVDDARRRDILIPDPTALALAGQPVDFDALAGRCPEISAIRSHILNNTPISDLVGVDGAFKNRLYAHQARFGPLAQVYFIDQLGRLRMRRRLATGAVAELLVLPQGEVRSRAVRQAHGDPSQGHFDLARSKEALRKAYTWPSDHRDLKAIIDACDCKRAKQSRQWQVGPPGHLPASREFDEIAVDWIGPFDPRFSRNQEKTWILHIRDTRWGLSLLKKSSRKTAAAAVSAIVKRVYQQLGMLPRVIQSDTDTTLCAGQDFK